MIKILDFHDKGGEKMRRAFYIVNSLTIGIILGTSVLWADMNDVLFPRSFCLAPYLSSL
jgi:hypothetical protein